MGLKDIKHYLDNETLQRFSKFSSVEELEFAYWKHVESIKNSNLSKSWQTKLIRLLRHIKENAKKFKGVFFEFQKTTAEFLGLKKADTVGQWIDKLVELQIVGKVHTKRINGQQTSNIVYILPIKKLDAKEDSAEEKQEIGDKEPTKNGDNNHKPLFPSENTNKNNNIKPNRHDDENTEDNYVDFLPKHINKGFAVRVARNFGYKMVFSLYRRAKRLVREMNHPDVIQVPDEVMLESLNSTLVFYSDENVVWKKGKTEDTFRGYFYQTLKDKLFEYVYEQLGVFSSSTYNRSSLYNWL